MCGILGLYSQKPIEKSIQQQLSSQLESLSHRGPDAQGIFFENKLWLGHRRLSIIDTGARANQPFKIGDYVLIFNGEIYNYQALREELESQGDTFTSTSDTEVLLRGYIRHKEAFFKKLDGMWAFAIYNKKSGVLVLCRDRIGEKPLYVSLEGKQLLFCSELVSMLPLLKNKQPNWQALALFNTLNLNHIPSPLTPFLNVQKLLPGTYLRYDGHKAVTKQYFSVTKKKIENPVLEATDLLENSVRQTLVSDVPVGILLSGGVDSSLIAALCKNKNMITYSFGMDKNDEELKRAGRVARKLKLKNKQVIFKGSHAHQDPIKYFRRLVREFGEPYNLYQIAYTRQLLGAMRKDGIKVAVGGNGADELFYGYDGSNKLKLFSDVRELFDWMGLSKILFALTKSLLFAPATKVKSLRYEQAMRKKRYVREEYRSFPLHQLFEKYATEIESKKIIDIFGWQGLRVENEHSVTMVVDHAGMRESMEVRTPFLNKDVIDFSCSLPAKYKTGYVGKTKKILREVLKNLLPSAAQESKMGFGYNVKHEDPLIRQRAQVKKIFSRTVPKLAVFDFDVVKQMLTEHVSGVKNQRSALMEVLIVALWFEECC